MKIIKLERNNKAHIEQAAYLLTVGFKQLSPNSWTNMQDAHQEVYEFFGPGRICRLAIDENDQVVGWVGGIREYDGHVWELHPLVVNPDMQRNGIGRALVLDFENQVRELGGDTVILGTDDEMAWTSVSNQDLYTDIHKFIREIRNLSHQQEHPFNFYRKLGYSVVGLIPDANGPGKPDILMAKRMNS